MLVVSKDAYKIEQQASYTFHWNEMQGEGSYGTGVD